MLVLVHNLATLNLRPVRLVDQPGPARRQTGDLMLHSTKRLALLAASASVFTLAICLSAAQAADTAPNTVSEIVVTAQKKSESQQNVPISVKAITGQTLDQLNAESAEDYLRLVPS